MRDVEIQELAGGELMIEPVHGAILQIGERIVACGARQLVFGENGLLLPRMDLVGGTI